MEKKIENLLQATGKEVRIIILLLYDACAVCFAEYLALLTRFDFKYSHIEVQYIDTAGKYLVFNIITTIIIFSAMKLYNSLWKYASVQEMLGVVSACLITSGIQVIGMHMLYWTMPRSYYILYLFFLMALTAFSRFLYRGVRVVRRNLMLTKDMSRVRTMIIGAGDAACILIKEMNVNERIHNRAVCVIDADERKIGNKILQVPIVGNDTMIVEASKKYQIQEIILAVPKVSAKRRKEILEICKNTGCKIRTVPSISQLVNEEVSISSLKDVGIEDLLGREPVETDLDEIMDYIRGRRVLVTGGGGSIGSELCRQIAAHYPKQLIIFDINENNTYELQLELKRRYPQLNLEVLIGSVRNEHRVDSIFEKYQPDLVFHAAAHKHVPLMETSPNEAIKNNVFGTLHVAKAAGFYGTKRMVLISTDKAVNPTNIMGASKRLCEMVIQGMNRVYPKTCFVAVRFGNVLGSSGSVVPLFKKQIAEGGPVTVTDRNIIRYFMTIPEAVSLVLQAGTYAKGGEIFVLDMGEPVKIDDMARNLIRLSGLEPEIDIEIKYTGLRPGEKLFEECLKSEEGLEKTRNNLIYIGKPIEFDEKKLFHDLKELEKIANEDSDKIREKVHSLVPSYVISNRKHAKRGKKCES